MTDRFLRWGAALLWTGVVWVAGGRELAADETRSVLAWLVNLILPGWPAAHPEGMRLLNMTARKVGHFLEYGILWTLWFRALPGRRRGGWAAGLSVALASLDEYRQTFLPERSGSLVDVAIDTLGILTTQWIVKRRSARPPDLSQITSAPSAEAAMRAAVHALKRSSSRYSWVGIYLVEGEELVLGPSLGKPSPHERIPIGQGICGAAAAERATIVVPDVRADPRYLACSLETRSEIVIPILQNGTVLGEIDIDSDTPDAFTPEDRDLLERVAAALAPIIAASPPSSS